MKILGIEIKRTPTGDKQEKTAIFTGSTYVDGIKVKRDNLAYYTAYERNIDIYRCIEEKCQATMKQGWEIQKPNGEDYEMVYDEVVKSAFRDIEDVKNKILISLDVFGDAFIRKKRNLQKNVIGYEVLDTREVSVVTDQLLRPVRYGYRRKVRQSVSTEVYQVEDIYHMRNGTNLDNPIFGTSPLSRLMLDSLVDEQIGMKMYSWYKNGSIPSSLFIVDKNLSPDEKDVLDEYIHKKLSGTENSNKSIISDGIEDIKVIEQPQLGSDVIEKRKYVTEKICGGFGVPRTVLGYIEDVNHSNGESQQKKFIEGTIIPLEKKLEKVFTDLLKDFDETYIFIVNSDHLDQTSEMSDIAIKNVTNGIWTRNEARTWMRWDVRDDEIADSLTVPSTQQLLDNLMVGEPELDLGVDI